jgi:CRP/FNR family transcriptional regulator
MSTRADRALCDARQARARLLRRGDAAEGAYLLVDGVLRVYYITPEGREATLYRVLPGEACILALTSTLREAPYPAWVDAGPEGASFVRIPTAVFHRLFDRETEFRAFVLGALSSRVLDLMRVLEETGSARIEQRVARLLEARADREGVVVIRQTQIAAELGTAREVVFRALRSLASQRLVETGRGRVRVLDGAGLRRATGLEGKDRRT